jgi:hypothetical protein
MYFEIHKCGYLQEMILVERDKSGRKLSKFAKKY